MRPLTDFLTRRAIHRAVTSLGGDVAVTVAATILPVFGAAGERRRVFYATDDFAAGARLMGLDDRWVRRREQAARRDADTVIVVSEHLAEKWRTDGVEPVVVENGVDDKLFAGTDTAPLPDDVMLADPIVGFVGHLSDRIDLGLLEAVAGRGCSLLLVGPRQLSFELARVEQLLSRPNVQWVGAKPFLELPSYVRRMAVGVLPYADTEFNRSSFPLKVLEYLAAGRPAVTTDLPAVRGLGEAVVIASGPQAFADAVMAAIQVPGDLATDQRPAGGRRQPELGCECGSVRRRDRHRLNGPRDPDAVQPAIEGHRERHPRQSGWLEDRVELFERYCLPSVAAQTDRRFSWIIYFDPQSPAWLRQRIEGHTAAPITTSRCSGRRSAGRSS